jgi:hypothetical protein
MSSPPDTNEANAADAVPASPPQALPNPKPSLTTPDGHQVMPPASRSLKRGLGLLHVVLPLLLIYMLFKVWPPHEWPRVVPEDEQATAAASPSPSPATAATTAATTQATTTNSSSTDDTTQTPTPAPSPASTSTPQSAAGDDQSKLDELSDKVERLTRAVAARQQAAGTEIDQSRLDTDKITFLWGYITVTTSIDERFLLLVIVAGALGSYIHAGTSYADFVGNRKFTPSWTWWYILRPFIGTGLALVVYFAIRGGFLLLANDVAAEKVNPYGIAAIAALVGMFSKQATDKLNEVFSTLFRPKEGSGDSARKDSLDETGTAISPKRTTIGTGKVALTVTGNNFVAASVVQFAKKAENGDVQYTDLPTQFKTVNQLIADLEPENMTETGTYLVRVFTPEPGGGATRPVEFEVFEADDAS